MPLKMKTYLEKGYAYLFSFETYDFNQLSDFVLRVARNKVAIAAVLIFSFGCYFDHLTTVYGIILPNLTEANPVVLQLIELGIWHETEIFLIIIGIYCGIIVGSMKPSKMNEFSLSVLATAGLSRFVVAISNLVLIINAF